MKTNNCSIRLLIRLSPEFHISLMYISSLINMMHNNVHFFSYQHGYFPDHPLEELCIFHGF